MNTRTSPVDTPRTDLVARLRGPHFCDECCESVERVEGELVIRDGLHAQAASVLERQARRIAVLEGALQEIVDADERWVQHARAALEETP